MPPKHLLAAILAALLAACAPARAAEVTVFAAASTTNAITAVAGIFAAQGLGTVRPTFASSSTLARQIEQGAPADIFVSADLKWMDYLDAKGLIVPASRSDLLGNALVLIAPADAGQGPVTVGKDLPLAALLGDGRLATGDPDHVPVGIYAKEALSALGLWAAAEPKLARAESVRAGLALVERGEAPLGIVYATDAAVAPKVKVIGRFPADSHKPIVYPAAIVAGRASPTAKAFLEFMKGDKAAAVFARYGFTKP